MANIPVGNLADIYANMHQKAPVLKTIKRNGRYSYRVFR